MELFEFKHVFLLQLFQREVGRGFIVAHVVVPSLRELHELGSLSSFDVGKLVLLSGPDVVALPCYLLL